MQSKFLDVTKVRVHYLEVGSGEFFVFIPGIGVTSKSLSHLGEKLSEKFRVIIPDLYKGKSKSANSPETLEDYADLLHEFVSKLRLKRFLLAGWSIGGLIVSTYLQKYPKPVSKAILVSSSSMHMKFMENPTTISKGYIKLFLNNITSVRGLKFLHLWITDIASNFIKNPSTFIKEIKVGMYDTSLTRPKKLPVRSKILAGKNDEYVSGELVKRENSNIENLEVETIEGGHDWFYHNEDLFLKKIIKFTQSTRFFKL